MPAITYIEFDGTEYHVDVAVENSVMEGALNNMIDGIVAECGGCCVCCTCHCMIDPEWSKIVGDANDDENELLEMLDVREPTSRLSCQVQVSAEMDGMVVRLPESQY
jgi:2Fe-2S ferredoxin